MRNVILVIMLVFIGWFIWQVEWHRVPILLAKIDIGEITILVCTNVAIFLLFCVRWWVIFCGMKINIPLQSIIKNRLVGFAISYITPGPQLGGEPLQIHLLKTVNNVETVPATSSLFLERYVDFLANFSFLLFATLYLVLHDKLPNILLLLSLPIFVAYVSIIVFYVQQIPCFSIVLSKCQRLKKISSLVYEVEKNIIAFVVKAQHYCLILFILSMAIWLLTIYEMWFTLYSLDLVLSLTDTLMILVTLRIALLTPLPGSAGVLEYSQMWIISYLKFDHNISAITALFIRGRDACFTLLGLYYWRELSKKDD